MDEAIRKKHARFKADSALKKGGMTAESKGQKLPTLMPNAWQSMSAIWMGKSEAEKEGFTSAFFGGDVFPHRQTEGPYKSGHYW